MFHRIELCRTTEKMVAERRTGTKGQQDAEEGVSQVSGTCTRASEERALLCPHWPVCKYAFYKHITKIKQNAFYITVVRLKTWTGGQSLQLCRHRSAETDSSGQSAEGEVRGAVQERPGLDCSRRKKLLQGKQIQQSRHKQRQEMEAVAHLRKSIHGQILLWNEKIPW